MITELDKLMRAREYMGKLANGIDPISDAEMPKDTVLNNVRLSRCFFYVYEVLGREILREKKANGIKKMPFSLTEEQIDSFPLSQNPVTISEFVDTMNSFINPEQMFKMGTTKITNWLLEQGFLYSMVDDRGKNTRRPTEKGNSIGISVVEREGMYGAYVTNLYNLAAQQLILSFLPQIVAASEEK